MVYSPATGDVADAAWRSQAVSAFSGDYPVEPIPSAALGDSTTSIQTVVSSGAAVFGGDPVSVAQQTVTHPDGDATDPRVDLITIDSNGAAGRMVGTPAPADPADRRFPNTRQPVPPTPTPADTVVVVAALWVPAGTTASSELFNDYMVPREVSGAGLFDLDLIPGRDLQYVIDTAREGETLVADASQTITLDQPLTVGTAGVTLVGLDVAYADGAASSDTDDTITVAADDVTLRNVTIDGNKANQTAEPDGVTVLSSDVSLENVTGTNVAGHLVNLNGATNTVRGTKIDGLHAADCEKDALVIQGESATGTRGASIESRRSAQRGTVTIRNGPANTALSGLVATDQADGVVIEDFGPDNDASAGVDNTTIGSLNATRCDQAVDAAHSEGHAGSFLTLRNIRVANMNTAASAPSSPNSLIRVENIATVDITDCRLRDTGYTDGYQIAVSNNYRTTIENCKLSNNASDFGLLRLFNANAVKILGCDLWNSPGRGVFATAGGEDVKRLRIGGCDVGNVTGDDVFFTEGPGAVYDRVIVTDNLLDDGGVSGTISGTNTNIAGNL